MQLTKILICAWVLWAQVVGADGMLAGALSAWPTRAECEEARETRDWMTSARAKAAAPLVCLPDTVDPRGPKR